MCSGLLVVAPGHFFSHFMFPDVDLHHLSVPTEATIGYCGHLTKDIREIIHRYDLYSIDLLCIIIIIRNSQIINEEVTHEHCGTRLCHIVQCTLKDTLNDVDIYVGVISYLRAVH